MSQDKETESPIVQKGKELAGMAIGAALMLEKPNAEAQNSETKKSSPEPIVTHHSIEIDGEALNYTVTTGFLPVNNAEGTKEAEIFFMAYTVDESPEKRPLMFSFNGGPGSSSVWLHLGALGPRRVLMQDDGNLPPPPYRLVNNPYTWLKQTDLVFIDPVGTGYSRPAKPELGKKFWSVQGDIESVGEFIRLYLARYKRWSSPLFLVGESYGTTRAAGLSGHLIEKGVAFNGIILVSSVLNFQTLRFDIGNDLTNILFLPTYTATAWYHKRLPAELQTDLRHTLAEVEAFAANEYTLALAKGDGLTEVERAAIVERLAYFTGLDSRFIENNNLRIEIFRFCKELLREQRRTVGRLDSRILGYDASNHSERPDHDPSMTAIRPPYTSAFNDYVRRELGFESDMEYYILGGGVFSGWDWGNQPGYPDTSEALRSAFAKNPYMKLYVASGYYDLATPYFATNYTLNHMNLAPEFRDRIQLGYYEAGHMMYIHVESLRRLQEDVSNFLVSALS